MIRYEDISAAIQVCHLQVEIAEALTFEHGDRAELAADALASRGFDQAPVVEGDRVIGLVRVAGLRAGRSARLVTRSRRSAPSISCRPTRRSRGRSSG